MDERTRQLNEHVLQNLPNRGGDPDRPKILALNAEFRKDYYGGVGDDFYVTLNIPVPDMRVLEILFPDLTSPDAETMHRAVQKFIASPLSAPYKVRKNDGKRGLQKRGVIVR